MQNTVSELLNAYIHTRLEWSDMQFWGDIILMLDTQGWQKIIEQDVASTSDENTKGVTSYVL